MFGARFDAAQRVTICMATELNVSNLSCLPLASFRQYIKLFLKLWLRILSSLQLAAVACIVVGQKHID